MEKLLKRLARQLQSVDEASLMSLWDKYQDRVKMFEPTKRWEEAVIVLSMIQAVRWKNQLFNSKWSEQQSNSLSPLKDSPVKSNDNPKNKATIQGFQPKKGKIIPFRQEDEDLT